MRPLGPLCTQFSGRKTTQRAHPGRGPSRLSLSTSRAPLPPEPQLWGAQRSPSSRRVLAPRTGQPSVGVGTRLSFAQRTGPPSLAEPEAPLLPRTGSETLQRRFRGPGLLALGLLPSRGAATRMKPLVENTAAQGKELHFPIFGADTITAILLTGKRA